MQRFLPSEIFKAAALLKRGVPVAFPTETVYGLGAPVFHPETVLKIFQMKGRPSDNPLICHIASLDQLGLLARDIPEAAFKLASHFWPGPLTLILKKQPEVPSCVTAGHTTVAIRMPSHPIALEFIRQLGQPLVAPSANKSGKPSSTKAEHVLEDFEEGGVIDGGPAPGGLESTVLYLADSTPRILRPGLIRAEALAEVLGRPIESGEGSVLNESPGTKYRHYAPLAKIRIVETLDQASSDPSLFRMSTEPHPAYHHLTAATLYALLRQADLEGCKEIVVVWKEQNNPALKDRLFRAAGYC